MGEEVERCAFCGWSRQAAEAQVEALRKALEGLIGFAEDAETRMLVGDEGCIWAVERARAALASSTPESVKPRSDPRWAQAAVCLHQAGFHDLGEFIDQAEESSEQVVDRGARALFCHNEEWPIERMYSDTVNHWFRSSEPDEAEVVAHLKAQAMAVLAGAALPTPAALAEARGDQPEGEAERCPACGYTEEDKRTLLDHHLCPTERGL